MNLDVTPVMNQGQEACAPGYLWTTLARRRLDGFTRPLWRRGRDVHSGGELTAIDVGNMVDGEVALETTITDGAAVFLFIQKECLYPRVVLDAPPEI